MSSLSERQLQTVRRLFSEDDRSYRELAEAIEAVPNVERMLRGVAARLQPDAVDQETRIEDLIRSHGTRWVMRYLSAYASWRKIRMAGRPARAHASNAAQV